ncbi:uncharacterized protein BT62DRAFT_932377 [Guyanagaster necrorhizus]|uniref:Uncharacterized protein n=1 Tax=Guyanagaster necrorhizus TaxID=856835 RepID=A0A9P7VUC3_9AGAR|nr:uncharacterized protein BT62DRAFT_932377 [Guyanagaster necrorhizus MCA 3950]KAG7446036.1 hypothetical protein BT62DRAFT_932377 [Guyanagaster necrorhizus MCA 3950]
MERPATQRGPSPSHLYRIRDLVKILHLPDDWRVSFKSDVDAVQNDQNFKDLLRYYLDLCNEVGTSYDKERHLYCPHTDVCNRVIDVAQMQPGTKVSDDDIIEFFRMDPYLYLGSRSYQKVWPRQRKVFAAVCSWVASCH